jgi:hypothetical protein
MPIYRTDLLCLDPKQLRAIFDREPMGFIHNLANLDLFKIESLHALAAKMGDSEDYFISESARSPDTKFFDVARVPYKPKEAIERLDTGAYRVLLKRAENHDRRFRELIDALFDQVVELLGGLGGQKVVRLESGILISSAFSITPFHYDPEVAFFSQIEGKKMYHVYSPTVISEKELERFSILGPVALAPVELRGRDLRKEYIFSLDPGKGFHQPQNSPHWVETGKARSISYTFVFETDAMRAVGRTRAFNHYLRKFGLKPTPLGFCPRFDMIKGDAMRAGIPMRQRAVRVLEKVRSNWTKLNGTA